MEAQKRLSELVQAKPLVASLHVQPAVPQVTPVTPVQVPVVQVPVPAKPQIQISAASPALAVEVPQMVVPPPGPKDTKEDQDKSSKEPKEKDVGKKAKERSKDKDKEKREPTEGDTSKEVRDSSPPAAAEADKKEAKPKRDGEAHSHHHHKPHTPDEEKKVTKDKKIWKQQRLGSSTGRGPQNQKPLYCRQGRTPQGTNTIH
jgi:hypothetical protein